MSRLTDNQLIKAYERTLQDVEKSNQNINDMIRRDIYALELQERGYATIDNQIIKLKE